MNTTPEMIARVIRHIAAFRPKHVSRLLDVCYGPSAKPLRTQVMALLLDRKVTGSDSCVQWGNFRECMWKIVGAQGECIASRDADFERIAGELLTKWT